MRERVRLVLGAGAAVGVLLGVFLTYAPHSEASRNSSGTYSLPTGNPVVSGTTITSTWANATLSDMGTELTNSLDRSGRGAMTAPLQCSNGSVSAPGLTFATDTDTGLYRAGAGDMRAGVDATRVQQWTSSGSLFSQPLTAQAAFISQDGGTFTTLVANGNAITATGTGTGSGVRGTGGATGTGVYGAGGASSGLGISGVGGGGASTGIQGTGGTGGTGVYGVGGGTGGVSANGVLGQAAGTGTGVIGLGGDAGVGVSGTGTGAAVGGYFSGGTAASGGTRHDALTLSNGDLDMSGVAAPTKTTASSNRLTPTNIVKAWAVLTTQGGVSNNVALTDGFNTTSATLNSNNVIRVTLASAFGGTTYAVVVTNTTAGYACNGTPVSTTTFDISCYGVADGSAYNFNTEASKVVNYIAIGAQ